MSLRLAFGLTLGGGQGGAVGTRLPAYSTINVFGDSIGAGTAASPIDNSFANLIATETGAALSNQSISGTVLQNSTGRANNGRDRYKSALTGANKRDAVFMAYGFNDARYIGAPGVHTAIAYESDLEEVIYGLILAGYGRADIYVISPFYITDTGLVTGSTGFSGQSRAGYLEYVNAAEKVARSWAVKYIDIYDYMLNNGGASLISGDNIHPNNAGHAAIFDGVKASSVPTVAGEVTFTSQSSPAEGEIAASWTSTGSPVSFDIRIYIDGLEVADLSGNQVGTSILETGLTGATYLVVVRPVFASSVGSWEISAPVTVMGVGVIFSMLNNIPDYLENCTYSMVSGKARLTCTTAGTIRGSWDVTDEGIIPDNSNDYEIDASAFDSGDTPITVPLKIFRSSAAETLTGTGTVNHVQSTANPLVFSNAATLSDTLIHVGLVATLMTVGDYVEITIGTVGPS